MLEVFWGHIVLLCKALWKNKYLLIDNSLLHYNLDFLSTKILTKQNLKSRRNF